MKGSLFRHKLGSGTARFHNVCGALEVSLLAVSGCHFSVNQRDRAAALRPKADTRLIWSQVAAYDPKLSAIKLWWDLQGINDPCSKCSRSSRNPTPFPLEFDFRWQAMKRPNFVGNHFRRKRIRIHAIFEPIEAHGILGRNIFVRKRIVRTFFRKRQI